MTPQEFEHALRIGLGRAILWLRNRDATPYRDVILECCLHNTAYDRQVEGSRARYMLDILAATPDAAWYGDRISAALMNLAPDTEAHDLHQQLDIALVFAQRGGIRAREAIYARFAASVADDDDLGLRAVVRLDGASGLAYAIGALEPHIGDYVGTEAEELRELAEERSGEAETERLLKEVAAANPALQSFVKSALRRRHPAAAPARQLRRVPYRGSGGRTPDHSIPCGTRNSRRAWLRGQRGTPAPTWSGGDAPPAKRTCSERR